MGGFFDPWLRGWWLVVFFVEAYPSACARTRYAGVPSRGFTEAITNPQHRCIRSRFTPLDWQMRNIDRRCLYQ
ncbi:hypothetical protein F5Y04DRAFT_266290 [Hypomontagnella monticulosa]|nr:hypothetical protein F5Y04DRAFT_266290 [Hypomontagnella monticulosa]